MRNFRDIKVWEKSHALTLSITRSHVLSRRRKSTLSQARCGELPHPFRRTSQKEAVVEVTLISHGYANGIGSASELEYLLLWRGT